MKYYRFPDNRLTRIGFIVFLFVMLLLARDTLITSSILGFYKATFISYGLIAIVGVAFLWVNRKNLKQILLDGRMLLVLIATAVFLVPMLVKQDWQLMYVSILICIYFAVFLSFFVSMETVAKLYVIIILSLSLYSLCAQFFLKRLVEVGILTVPQFINSAERPFYNFGLAFVTAWENYSRNFGIFREPGVYQFFLIIAIFLNSWKIQWKQNRMIYLVDLVLAVTMLTTQSTNGVVELAFLTVVLFFDKKLYKSKPLLAVFGIATVAVIGVIGYSIFSKTVLYDYLNAVFRKLFYQSDSAMARMASLIVNAEFFLNSPVFGEKISTVLYVVADNTSSTMILFAIYGIVGGLLHIAGWVALVWDRSRNVLLNVFLLTIIFISFNTQNLTWDILFWLFPTMAFMEKAVPWLEAKFCRKT